MCENMKKYCIDKVGSTANHFQSILLFCRVAEHFILKVVIRKRRSFVPLWRQAKGFVYSLKMKWALQNSVSAGHTKNTPGMSEKMCIWLSKFNVTYISNND